MKNCIPVQKLNGSNDHSEQVPSNNSKTEEWIPKTKEGIPLFFLVDEIPKIKRTRTCKSDERKLFFPVDKLPQIKRTDTCKNR